MPGEVGQGTIFRGMPLPSSLWRLYRGIRDRLTILPTSPADGSDLYVAPGESVSGWDCDVFSPVLTASITQLRG